MIFVATGTQFPFDRLIRYIDDWAKEHDEEIFAQLGHGKYLPKHMQWERFLSLEEYNHKIAQASVFISHAGMGNIISARDNQTPIIVINRQADLGEHRNDHQRDGIKWMGELSGIYAARTREDIYHYLEDVSALEAAQGSNSDERLDALVEFLDSTLTKWHKG